MSSFMLPYRSLDPLLSKNRGSAIETPESVWQRLNTARTCPNGEIAHVMTTFISGSTKKQTAVALAEVLARNASLNTKVCDALQPTNLVPLRSHTRQLQKPRQFFTRASLSSLSSPYNFLPNQLPLAPAPQVPPRSRRNNQLRGKTLRSKEPPSQFHCPPTFDWENLTDDEFLRFAVSVGIVFWCTDLHPHISFGHDG